MNRTITAVTAPHGLDFELTEVKITEHDEYIVSGRRLHGMHTDKIDVFAGTPVSFLFNPTVAASVLAGARVIEIPPYPGT